MDIKTEIEFEIDPDEIVEEAEEKVKEYAEEVLTDADVLKDAIDNFDMTEKINEGVEEAVNNLLDDKLEEYLLGNPATLLKAMHKALEWSLNQRQLVIDQARELEAKRRRILELVQNVEDLTNPTNQEEVQS